MKIFLINTYLFLMCFLSEESLAMTTDTSFAGAIKKTVIGVNLSTQGIGGTISMVIPSKVVLVGEVGYSFFKYTKDINYRTPEESDIFFQPDIHQHIVTGMISWYPFKKRLIYFKSGIGYGIRQRYFVRVTSPTGLLLGGVEISSEDFGQVDLAVQWSRLMPYVGVGIGRPSPKKKLGVSFNVGCFYMGSPKLLAQFEGFLESTTLDSQIAVIQKNMKNYSYFPVLSVSLRYRIK
ncbi:hypothetical protein [Emticicia agri]|uniref:Outer membrane protein beta-barrel domain-containing protein n=1 Tax=Emticicia agri TaxID=2492393 RepID=A0A4Q5LVH9_9BACT|nr:hypothetical protein [Emticicia agri]RYU93736.1 hypothetical protein EWM59_20675 [Emticicia agri]